MGKNRYDYIPNVLELIGEIPNDSIVSRTFYQGDDLRAILFGFAPGQELTEHTASKAAVLHFLEGEADIVLGEDRKMAASNAWIYMPPGLPHSIHAKTRVILLLLLVE
jgi:quercetin dioxygenase-like cupin family protein